MARKLKKNAQKNKDNTPESSIDKENRRTRRLLMLLASIIAVGFFPLFMVFTVAMLPTITLMLVEKNKNKYRTKTVAFLNFSGAFNMIAPMLRYEGLQTFERALEIVTDVWQLIVPFGLSGFGYAIVLVLPLIVNSFLSKSQLIKEKALMEQKSKIITQWGEDVGHNAQPLLSIEQLRAEEATKNLKLSQSDRALINAIAIRKS